MTVPVFFGGRDRRICRVSLYSANSCYTCDNVRLIQDLQRRGIWDLAQTSYDMPFRIRWNSFGERLANQSRDRLILGSSWVIKRFTSLAANAERVPAQYPVFFILQLLPDFTTDPLTQHISWPPQDRPYERALRLNRSRKWRDCAWFHSWAKVRQHEIG